MKERQDLLRFTKKLILQLNKTSSKKHVLVACFPKSGSTYLSKLISNLFNLEKIDLVTGYGRREQELSLEKLVLNINKNYVAQHHVRLSKVTKNILEEYSILSIVLVRNIYDIVESLYDHYHKEGLEAPMAFIPDEFLSWSKDKATDFIIDVEIPWFFNFYVSWYHDPKKFLITYDDVFKNPFTTMEEISKYVGINCTKSDIQNAIEKTQQQPTRKNVAKSGRGKELSEIKKNRIKNISKFYEGVDFSPIGI